MNDYIKITGLEIYANHGVLKEENLLGQKFIVNVIMYLDLGGAGKSDDLSETIDYSLVCRKITDFTKNHTFRLIEALAFGISEMLFDDFKLLKAVEITVEKPWAPVHLHIDSLSVTIKRSWHTAYIAMGSNMGDKEQYITTAIQKLNAEKSCTVSRVSTLIETKPYGVTDQDDFLNGVMEIKTYLEPYELLHKLQRMEYEANRVRDKHWGPRTLDLDILLYDNLIISTEELCVPHIDMQNRLFVLQPFEEIAPYAIHPVFNKTIRQMLLELSESR